MTEKRSNDPLHGKTLQSILEDLVERYGWEELGDMIRINCFLEDPSVKSSLTFLRKTPWARTKVENLYLESLGEEIFRPAPPRPKIEKLRIDRSPDAGAKPRVNLWTGKPFDEEE